MTDNNIDADLDYFDAYEAEALRTFDRDMLKRDALTMAGLGLTGEAGEVVEHIKKHVFHGHHLDRDKVAKELGDVLWYVAVAAHLIDVPLRDVAERNARKLRARYPDGFVRKDAKPAGGGS